MMLSDYKLVKNNFPNPQIYDKIYGISNNMVREFTTFTIVRRLRALNVIKTYYKPCGMIREKRYAKILSGTEIQI